MSVIVADTLRARAAGAAVTTTEGLNVEVHVLLLVLLVV